MTGSQDTIPASAPSNLPNPWLDNPRPSSELYPNVVRRLKKFKNKKKTMRSPRSPWPYRQYPKDGDVVLFFEYRGYGMPPDDIGLPGDIYLDLTTFGASPHLLYSYHGSCGWICTTWSPDLSTTRFSLARHPLLKDRYLWGTEAGGFMWFTRGFLRKLGYSPRNGKQDHAPMIQSALQFDSGGEPFEVDANSEDAKRREEEEVDRRKRMRDNWKKDGEEAERLSQVQTSFRGQSPTSSSRPPTRYLPSHASLPQPYQRKRKLSAVGFSSNKRSIRSYVESSDSDDDSASCKGSTDQDHTAGASNQERVIRNVEDELAIDSAPSLADDHLSETEEQEEGDKVDEDDKGAEDEEGKLDESEDESKQEGWEGGENDEEGWEGGEDDEDDEERAENIVGEERVETVEETIRCDDSENAPTRQVAEEADSGLQNVPSMFSDYQMSDDEEEFAMKDDDHPHGQEHAPTRSSSQAHTSDSVSTSRLRPVSPMDIDMDDTVSMVQKARDVADFVSKIYPGLSRERDKSKRRVKELYSALVAERRSHHLVESGMKTLRTLSEEKDARISELEVLLQRQEREKAVEGHILRDMTQQRDRAIADKNASEAARVDIESKHTKVKQLLHGLQQSLD
ncbi:hypothetical protein Hypma_006334 [Hypsizygus marmoreus]|uniref:Uncharacterized protein n=1 Tax=Hypsizygus marmoreus TaxID=39966 RepID=A0A369K392_HYPMA|nr:hypothetical protein Hypma_006334 [Hypsizygus marmoreus]